VRYDAVNAMLLNEFLKEHRKVEEQAKIMAEQRKQFESRFAGQQKQIDALTSALQRLDNELALDK
jgi:hypothetical protein